MSSQAGPFMVRPRREPAKEEAMRLDGVEVKVSLDSDQTAAAVQALDLAVRRHHAGVGLPSGVGISPKRSYQSADLTAI
jgi:hypothetical protein